MRRADRRKAVSTGSNVSRPTSVKSVCVACGSCNVVSLPPQQQQRKQQSSSAAGLLDHNGELIQCRSCGLVAPNFNQRKAQHGFQDDYVPLESFKAQSAIMYTPEAIAW